MKNYALLLDSFKNIPILVLGDLMLDEYVFGTANRISAEAPVMVIRQTETKAVPGGAANVAGNLAALGANALVAGVVGEDAAGRALGDALAAQGMDSSAIIADSSRPTTRKTRILANHSHQVLRIDVESTETLDAEAESRLRTAVERALQGVKAVLLSDYRKGAITVSIARYVLDRCAELQIPVIANLKPDGLESYHGAGLVSLNRAEATEALRRMGTEFPGDHALKAADAVGAAERLRDHFGFGATLITLGAEGMAGAWRGGAAHVPAVPVEVYDEAGAGDTVIATVALATAVGQFGPSAMGLAAELAAAVIRHIGVCTPSSADLDRLRALSALE